jgi:hypothetical protein
VNRSGRARWSVPRENFALLSSLTAAESREAARRTRERLDRCQLPIGGTPLGRLRREARSELLGLAADYLRTLGDSSPVADPDAPVIVTGHQPELFHPGVWAKNVAAAALAGQVGSAALNLIVDSDIQAKASVTIPIGSAEDPQYAELPYDTVARRPWEEAQVESPELFAEFGNAMGAAMAPWGVRPIGPEVWEHAGSGSLIDRLVRVRRAAEIRSDVNNFELPMSWVCRSESFHRFAAHLILDATRFAGLYNAAIDEYRLRNKIRSDSHPAPHLSVHDDRVESPFWVWRDGDRTRTRLFTRRDGQRILFMAEEAPIAEGTIAPSGAAESVMSVLQQATGAGWRIATRALSTTLFTRLLFADLFLHGIGGAKYDELADQLLATFFGIEPPPFLVLTATLHLPLGEVHGVKPRDASDLEWRRRDEQWNPERYLPDESAEEALRRKLEIVQQIHAQTGIDRSASVAELGSLRSNWRNEIPEEMHQTQHRLQEVRRHLVVDRRLTNRDFAWPLHSETSLAKLWEKLRAELGSV